MRCRRCADSATAPIPTDLPRLLQSGATPQWCRFERRLTLPGATPMETRAPTEKKQNGNTQPFLTDVKTLRDRARKHITEGGVTPSYEGDVHKTIEILQAVLATEIVCVLR